MNVWRFLSLANGKRSISRGATGVCQVPEAVGRSFASGDVRSRANTLEVRIKQLALNCNFSPLISPRRGGSCNARITEHASNISQRVKPARTPERILSRGPSAFSDHVGQKGEEDPPKFIGLLLTRINAFHLDEERTGGLLCG